MCRGTEGGRERENATLPVYNRRTKEEAVVCEEHAQDYILWIIRMDRSATVRFSTHSVTLIAIPLHAGSAFPQRATHGPTLVAVKTP
jgi:hypothetical protein